MLCRCQLTFPVLPPSANSSYKIQRQSLSNPTCLVLFLGASNLILQKILLILMFCTVALPAAARTLPLAGFRRQYFCLFLLEDVKLAAPGKTVAPVLRRRPNTRCVGCPVLKIKASRIGVLQANMVPAMVLAILALFPLWGSAAAADGFTFNGFRNASLSLDGTAMVTPSGLLRLSNATRLQKGHAFLGSPLQFRRPAGGKPFSFSTTFVFAIVPEFPEVGSHGMAFVVSPRTNLPETSPGQYLGLFTPTNDGNASNHILAVEFDVLKNPQFGDIDDNHVGIDVNAIRSIDSTSAGYFANRSRVFENLTLASGDPVQAWVEFDSRTMQLNVTVAPFRAPKPERPLLSSTVYLSEVLLDSMYVGFSSATGRQPTTYYVQGWSFHMNGTAQALDPTSLPALPPRGGGNSKRSPLVIWLPVAGSMLLVTGVAAAVALVVIRKIKFAEILEDWEVEYGPHRFSYKDLFVATKGFVDKELLRYGGFGKVYRGVLPTSNMEVAVKRISHDSRQGMREFIAEIVSIGRLRHRNLVQLLGYCRRKGELLLVYDLMPNGSLDKFLFRQTGPTLDWNQRFRIIKGVASGLLYLHEGWEQVVIHRDIKASNVLLDSEFNGRLGDFGLARLYDHGEVLQTTHVVGTIGYLAPELTRTGKATKASDVFAFGAFLLEVACGKKPIERQGLGENFVLVDWVLEKWRGGALEEGTDPKLKGEYAVEEVTLVLLLGLHCSNPLPTARPSIRQVMQILEGDAPLPELPVDYMFATFPEQQQQQQSPQNSDAQMSCPTYSASGSLLYTGR